MVTGADARLNLSTLIRSGSIKCEFRAGPFMQAPDWQERFALLLTADFFFSPPALEKKKKKRRIQPRLRLLSSRLADNP